jgi:hypothetical protein
MRDGLAEGDKLRDARDLALGHVGAFARERAYARERRCVGSVASWCRRVGRGAPPGERFHFPHAPSLPRLTLEHNAGLRLGMPKMNVNT